ncbi:PadR family transcriptional regulator [Vallitalea pronyensis]|uniref:PadR family transcriptional regulator n=1 Tax=Vallitalea pronyensis TaxID=1348613 RepID=A0A8J8MQ38_9FIRM|nr:PadR family transcriptional regulator [Vallitalea pronyensis]QUI25328.1 PadR family transcriptional regulator [Vallitalea pronyensis]
MSVKNKSIYAILGILNILPSSGYDIKKYCDNVLSGFWNENFGHIYPTLKKMLADGTIEIMSKGKNEKKIQYKITSRGEQALDHWFLEETKLQPVRSEFMLKLFFSSHQPKEKVLQMIEKYKKVHQDKLEKYRVMEMDLEKGIEDISSERAKYIKATLRSGILSHEATIRWCNETIEEIC